MFKFVLQGQNHTLFCNPMIFRGFSYTSEHGVEVGGDGCGVSSCCRIGHKFKTYRRLFFITRHDLH